MEYIFILHHVSLSGTFDAHPLTDEKVNNMTTYLLDLYKSMINPRLINRYLIAAISLF